MTFLALFWAFRALPALPALTGFFAPLDANFPALRTALTAFLGFRAAAARFAGAAFLAGFLVPLGSTAPMAARIRLISRVTCSMVIMPSTVSSFRRSE